MGKLICCLIIVLASLAPQLMVGGQDEQQHFLEENSFELTVKVTERTSSSVQYILQVNEKYSAAQRRAKIELQVARQEKIGDDPADDKVTEFTRETYFVDKKTNVNLYLDHKRPKSCRKASDGFLSSSLNLIAVGRFSSIPSDSHVVGTARLLITIANNKHKLQVMKQSVEVRNIDAIEYRYNAGWIDSGSTIMVYYMKNDHLHDPQTNPIRIIYSNGNTFLVYDFSPIKLLQFDTLTSRLHRQVENGQVALDEFTFTPLSGCSEALAEHEKGESLFASRVSKSNNNTSLPPVKFSFVADVKQQVLALTQSDAFQSNMRWSVASEQMRSSNYKTFVAYDENLHALRVDTLASDLATSSSRLLYDFRTDRMYSLVDDRAARGEADNTVINVGPMNTRANCVIAPIENSGNLWIHVSLGKLLTGAEDSFIYLGRAQVRGISALVYEVVGSNNLPFWLDPPMPGKATKKGGNNGEDGPPTNTVLYYFGLRDLDHPLLMMEIYQHLDKEASRAGIYAKQTIEIYDFKWDLETIAPNNGDRASEMFSLRDHCGDPGAPNRHAELVFEQQTPELSESTQSWLSVPALRNQAILGGLHENLHLSPVNVFDLESRLVKSASDPKKSTIVVEFRYAEHPLYVKKLVYLGQGDPRGSPDGNLESFYVHSLRDCFLLAARVANSVEFAFDARESACLVDQRPVDIKKPQKDVDSEPNSFVLNEPGPLKVYRTYEAFGSYGGFIGFWISGDDGSRVKDQGKSIQFGYKEPRSDRAVFRVQRIHVQSINDGARLDQEDGTESGNSTRKPSEKSLDEIKGYGLSLADVKHNKLIKSVELDASLINPYKTMDGDDEATQSVELEMSPDYCRSKCLTDPECQSYHVCLINYRFQCVLSKLSLRSAHIMSQLKSLKRPKSGEKISVLLEDKKANESGQRIELIRRASCTIYNKQFSDLFDAPDISKQIPMPMSAFEAVRRRDDCAAKCALQNFKANSRMNDKYKEQMTDTENLKQSQTSEWKKLIWQDLCFGFTYVNSFDAFNLPENVRANLPNGNLSVDDIDGYCLLDSNKPEDMEAEDEGEPGRWPNDILTYHYKFNLVYMYEQHHGVALKATALTDAELTSLELVRKGLALSTDQIELVISMTKRGENFQLEEGDGEKSRCAMYCFLQTLNPWPACRSFDVIVEPDDDSSVVKCRLNSVTMKQVVASKKYELIENQTHRQLWHYEPAFGLAVNSLAGDIQLGLVDQILENIKFSSSSQIKLLLVILIALSSGLCLGVLIHRRYLSGFRLAAPSSGRSNSISELVLNNDDIHHNI